MSGTRGDYQGNVNTGTGSVQPSCPTVDSRSYTILDVGGIEEWADQDLTTWDDTNVPAHYAQGEQPLYIERVAGHGASLDGN